MFYIHLINLLCKFNEFELKRYCLSFISREKCGEKSLLILEELIQNQGFDYACKDDPDELILIMCGNQWDARECQIARQVLRHEWNNKLNGQANYKTSSLLLIIFLSIFLFIINF